MQGLVSKDMAYSTRLDRTEDYYGGAVAIARHLCEFSSNVTLMSIIGNEEEIYRDIYDKYSKKMDLNLYQSKEIPTIFKQRFLTKDTKREEYDKLFVINNIDIW